MGGAKFIVAFEERAMADKMMLKNASASRGAVKEKL
jgi:hypothetical protein